MQNGQLTQLAASFRIQPGIGESHPDLRRNGFDQIDLVAPPVARAGAFMEDQHAQ